MLVFPEISPQVLEEAAPSTSAPQSIYSYLAPSPSSLAVKVSDMKNLLRSFSNEIVNLKRAQVSLAKPPFQQSFQGNRPPYQHNQYTNHRTNKPSQLNGRIVPVLNPLQTIYPTTSKEMIVGQNNLVDDTNSWCFPCNSAHALRNCPRGNLQQKVREQRSLGMAPDEFVYTSPGMLLQQEIEMAPDHVLFSWMEDEDAMLTNNASTSKDGAPFVQSDYNLCSERCFTGECRYFKRNARRQIS